MAGSILFGGFPISVPEFILFGNWLLEGGFIRKWKLVKTNKIFWVLMSMYVLQFVGLIYTHEIKTGIDFVRIMIPIGLFPLVFFTTEPLQKIEFKVLLYIFITGLIVSSLWCLLYFLFHSGMDPRKAARFMSHIRLGLFVNLGISTLIYFIFKEEKSIKKILFAVLVIYLIYFMIKLSLITGLVVLVILTFIFTIYSVLKQNLIIKIISSVILLTVMSGLIYFIRSEWRAYKHIDSSPQNLPQLLSASARRYDPVMKNKHTENGYYIAYNIQFYELEKIWPQLSSVPVYKFDSKHNALMWTLIRYLSSKGLTKDSAGMKQLSKTDIQNIEKGIANYKYSDASPLRKRIKEFFWEYEDYKENFNPSGNTVLMRFEFWKAAVYIIERNILVGVGTGDAQRAFNTAYLRTNTNLINDWRLRSHNQFLAITVSFGLIGLFIFIFYLFYPLIKLKKTIHPLYYAFFCIAIISFLTEDTLESQTGVTFFSYFNALFLWMADSERKEKQLL